MSFELLPSLVYSWSDIDVLFGVKWSLRIWIFFLLNFSRFSFLLPSFNRFAIRVIQPKYWTFLHHKISFFCIVKHTPTFIALLTFHSCLFYDCSFLFLSCHSVSVMLLLNDLGFETFISDSVQIKWAKPKIKNADPNSTVKSMKTDFVRS